MRISTKIGLFISNSREDHRQALLTAAASSSAASTSQLVSACARRQPLPPEEVEGDQQDAVLYHPSSGKRNLSSVESSTEGTVALPAMSATLVFLEPLSSLISGQVISTTILHPI